MTKFKLAAAAAILASAGTVAYVASPALAQMAPAKEWGRHTTLTWADAKAKADEAWTRLDVNKDGKLDQSDRDAKMAGMFDKIDTDHNGSISKDEFIAHHRNMMDDHKDGKGNMPPPPMAGMEHDGPEGRGEHGRGHRGGGMMGHGAMGMLMMADANKDGVITRAEFDAATKAHFDKADANHDGKVTPEERRAAFGKMHARDGEPMPPPPAGGM
jgi:hypothetical protein